MRLFLLICLCVIPQAVAASGFTYAGLPENAKQNLPLLGEYVARKWPEVRYPHFLPAQIEKETCITLKHSKCWTSRAELKTKREYGWGFGQFTIAYNADGTERFNAFKDVKRLDPELARWDFDKNRFDTRYNMLAFVVRNKHDYYSITGAADELTRHAFRLSAYNGGRGGLLKDRRLCGATSGCNPALWFGHVEKTSYKSRVAYKGYGKSFYQVNREYVSSIIYQRSPKYEKFFTEEHP